MTDMQGRTYPKIGLAESAGPGNHGQALQAVLCIS